MSEILGPLTLGENIRKFFWAEILLRTEIIVKKLLTLLTKK